MSISQPLNHLLNADLHDDSSLPGFLPSQEYSVSTSVTRNYKPNSSHLFHMRKKTRFYFLSLSIMTALADPNFHRNLEILPDLDCDSKELLQSSLCEDCSERCKRCPKCKWENSPISLQEMSELKSIRESLSVQKHPTNNSCIIMCDYPFLGPIDVLYSSEKSNRNGAMRSTATLFRKLHKRNLASKFHAEIEKSIEDNHMSILSPDMEREILAGVHCYAFLNYSEKLSSTSQKIRPLPLMFQAQSTVSSPEDPI